MRRSRNHNHEFKTDLMIFGGLLLVSAVGARACAEAVEAPEQEIIEYIEDSGYNNPEITDIDKAPNPAIAFGCSEGHVVKYEFDATSANTGRDVSAIVCDGFLQGRSLRD